MAISIELAAILTLISIQIIFTIALIFQKNLFYCVVIITISSIISAVLFVIFNAPDIALAEIAVGCALIPFVYIISITKQKDFLILDQIRDESSQHIIEAFDEFCSDKKLRLKVLTEGYTEEYSLSNVLRVKNIDMVINKSDDIYEIACKSSSDINDQAIKFIEAFDFNAIVSFIRIGENVKED